MKLKLKLLFLYLFFLMNQGAIFACPACKDALGTEGALSLARGYFLSIMMMLSLPFILTGTLAFLIVRTYQRKKKILESVGAPV
ncbi:MAG: hypothetical protein HYS07_05940 [Chlamydiae bacterium]|nr:hypothetical protein [Chlamydiota bacterium]MBI3277253.1 hypothetical protein [Chlamydiota bacterium]